MRTLSLSSEPPTASIVELSSVEYKAIPPAISKPVALSSIPPPNSKIPSVTLDSDVITDNMAARLSMSFLGHVMFLKSQVPFPVIQLARMPGSNTTTRASKKRAELLNSLDTLASHLNTTFTALSTAIALKEKSGVRDSDGGIKDSPQHDQSRTSVAYLAIVLGSTIGAAKARVVLGVNGLEIKVWGEREGHNAGGASSGTDSEDDKESLEGSGSGESSSSEGSESERDSDVDSEHDDDEADCLSERDSQSGSEASCSDLGDSPPRSRSPSPTPSYQSTPGSEAPSPPPSPSRRFQSYAEEQETLRTAERLLSRTLASACAEGEETGMASEMAPTQTHILLRAPRRFVHPAWIPRQNLNNSMDDTLADFLQESRPGNGPHGTKKKRSKKGIKVEGVWIRSRGIDVEEPTEDDHETVAEEDEYIWWTWDGKLAGFADW